MFVFTVEIGLQVLFLLSSPSPSVALSPCRIRHCRLIPQPQVQPPNLSSELNYFCIVKSFMNIFPELHNQDATEIFRDTCYSHSSITNSFYKNTYIIPHTL